MSTSTALPMMEIETIDDHGSQPLTSKLLQSSLHTSVTVATDLSDSSISTDDSSIRRVRFTEEEPTYSDATNHIAPEDKEVLWWRPVEFKAFRLLAKKQVEHTITTDSTHHMHLKKVYQHCSQTPHPLPNGVPKVVANTDLRGLEVVMLPHIVAHRRAYVVGVLRTQAKLPENMPLEQRSQVLCAASSLLSRTARALAFVMALGDEEVARDLQ